ncbi:low molecular weight protein-tyrosine-phosphatase [Thiohalomonas denitrificans]|uniref:protein-tyrosine-phosphatase n=1 Tax=Thiohalomonas denitrificans TaxID=415747 RepID=A0A1G5Q8G6_9GAMM|nr:low molecular weight protein-tyrosine-phosphatase [Thiohalomonas denitrificans]SCZ57942.1 protein-tyrosine phosphatase [Thiohalomonas denitrificans]
MLNSILVVCVGNICRSPMAEGVLRARLGGRGINVSSAGIGALVGKEADPTAIELMKQRGIDISSHRARQLDTTQVRSSELILVMEAWHRQEIEQHFPMARGRVYTLGHWDHFNIPDPYRKPKEAFERALKAIEQGVETWLERL